jgi:hypothetical protein
MIPPISGRSRLQVATDRMSCSAPRKIQCPLAGEIELVAPGEVLEFKSLVVLAPLQVKLAQPRLDRMSCPTDAHFSLVGVLEG